MDLSIFLFLIRFKFHFDIEGMLLTVDNHATLNIFYSKGEGDKSYIDEFYFIGPQVFTIKKRKSTIWMTDSNLN